MNHHPGKNLSLCLLYGCSHQEFSPDFHSFPFFPVPYPLHAVNSGQDLDTGFFPLGGFPDARHSVPSLAQYSSLLDSMAPESLARRWSFNFLVTTPVSNDLIHMPVFSTLPPLIPDL
jgi:hypothetical protein